MVLHYQPQVSLATGHIPRVEALVRWQHPQYGLISPDRFIPLAEKTGLIGRLSRWVLNAALRQCLTWHQQGVDLQVTVNLSMRDLQDAQLPDTISTFLNLWKAAPTWLEVEITESALSADPERTLDIVTRLSNMGVGIAIDDFGTGYASLSYLKQLPVDEIKVDKAFVLGVTRDDNDAAIVRSTIDLGHTLNLTVVAKGIEDQATWDLLATLECDFAQGYFIAHPLPATDFLQWLQRSPWVTQPRPAISLATASRAYGRRGAGVG
jgi:EAL domain-containing protein (putative c-di-GMP-specific phosphodiesterase class I)